MKDEHSYCNTSTFYTKNDKSNKEEYRRLSVDDRISEELSQSNDSSSSSSRKQFFMKNFD